MIQRHSPFLKLEDYINCFADVTPTEALRTVPQEQDPEEAAYKWLALAILHGLSSRTDCIELTRSAEGDVKTCVPGETLQAPDRELAPKVFETIRRVAHLEADEGSVPLALGIRDDSLDCQVQVRRTGDAETLTIRLPVVGTA